MLGGGLCQSSPQHSTEQSIQHSALTHLIVPAQAPRRFDVLCDAVVEDLLDDVDGADASVETFGDEVADFLAGHDIPDAVASQDEEPVVGAQRRDRHVRLGGNHLPLSRNALDLLILEVSERAGKVEIAVDAPLVGHETACSLNTPSLRLFQRFVVLAQRHCHPVPAQAPSRVAGIGHIQLLACFEGYDGCAAAGHAVVGKIANGA